MQGDDDELDELALWLSLVRRDLQDSRTLLELGRLSNAAHLAQQTTEKLLEAILVAAERSPPRTHDLQRLVALLPECPEKTAPPPDMHSVSGWAVSTRYDEVSDMAAEQISDVLGWVEKALSRRGW